MSVRRFVVIALRALLPLVVLGLAGVGFVKLVKGRRPPPKLERVHRGPLVRVAVAEARDVAVTVKAYGTVRPRDELDVTPRVAGELVEVSPSLVSGGFVRRGELLLRIDPRDYELAVERARADVAKAEYELALARSRAEAARDEWRAVHGDAPMPPEDSLVLQGPQLAAARAGVAAARARLAEAELALERTAIRAPFDGRVLDETVIRGQYVAAGRAVARIYPTDVVEVVLPVSEEDLGWIGPLSARPRVRARARVAGRPAEWWGRVVRTEGVIDPETRMARLVAEFPEPFRRGRPPLTVGLFVEAEIAGRTLEGVVPIPAHALRENDTVWVVGGDGRLRIRRVRVARAAGSRVLVAEGLEPGDRVVLTRIDAVTDGMVVRVADGGS